MRSSLKPRSIYDVFAVIGCLAALTTGSAYAANTVFSEDIVDGEVKNADIGGGAVNSASVLDGSLTSDDLGPNSVGSAEIASNAVRATEIANSSIDGGEIVDGSMGAADLASSSVGSSEIDSGAVTYTELGGNSVSSSKVAANSLTTADIAGTDVTGTISAASGAVPNGRCEDFPTSVSGATAGEGVSVTLKGAAPQGVLFAGVRVPSAGTVTMKLCNLSGATLPAITNLPVRVITFG